MPDHCLNRAVSHAAPFANEVKDAAETEYSERWRSSAFGIIRNGAELKHTHTRTHTHAYKEQAKQNGNPFSVKHN